MRERVSKHKWAVFGALFTMILAVGAALAQEVLTSSYSPVVIKEPFAKTMESMKAAKPEVMKRHMDLLHERYDVSNRPAKGVMMSGGKKAVQEGVRVKLPSGMSWEKLANLEPEEIREKDFWPNGFFPLPPPESPGRRDVISQVPHRGD